MAIKSHAALLSDTDYPLSLLEEANILIPDIPLMDLRMKKLTGLPERLPVGIVIARTVSDFLENNGHFHGHAWLSETLETYMTEEFLIRHDNVLTDDLSGTMAETNAEFSDLPDFKDPKVEDHGHSIEVTAAGVYTGRNSDDRPYSGHKIDFTAKVILYRIAGNRGFSDYIVSAFGQIRDDWRGPSAHYLHVCL